MLKYIDFFNKRIELNDLFLLKYKRVPSYSHK